MGIGVALITVLNPSGVPTAPVVTMLYPPRSQMGPISSETIQNMIRGSCLLAKYEQPIDRKSARELLAHKIIPLTAIAAKRRVGSDKDIMGNLMHELINSKLAQAVGKEIVRSALGVLYRKPVKKRRT